MRFSESLHDVQYGRRSFGEMSALEKLFAKRPTPIALVRKPPAPVAEEQSPEVDVTKSIFYSATRRPTLQEFLHTNYLQLPQYRFVWEKAGWRGHLEEPRASNGYGVWNASSRKHEQIRETGQGESRQEAGGNCHVGRPTPHSGGTEGGSVTLSSNACATNPPRNSGEEIVHGQTGRVSKPRVRKVVKGGSIVTIPSGSNQRKSEGKFRDTSVLGESVCQQKVELPEKSIVDRSDTSVESDQVSAPEPEVSKTHPLQGTKMPSNVEREALQTEDLLIKSTPKGVQARRCKLNSLVTDHKELSSQKAEVNLKPVECGLKQESGSDGVQDSDGSGGLIISITDDDLEVSSGNTQKEGAVDRKKLSQNDPEGRVKVLSTEFAACNDELETSAEPGVPPATNSESSSGGECSGKGIIEVCAQSKDLLPTTACASVLSADPGAMDDMLESSEASGNGLMPNESPDMSNDKSVPQLDTHLSKSDGANSEAESVEELVMADFDSDDCLCDDASPASVDKQGQSDEETSDEEAGCSKTPDTSAPQQGVASRTRSASRNRRAARKKRADAKRKSAFEKTARQEVKNYRVRTCLARRLQLPCQ